jgi:hypothetical protein
MWQRAVERNRAIEGTAYHKVVEDTEGLREDRGL